MFTPKTNRIEKLSKIFPKVITELENIFDGASNIYIDWANVIHWQDKLGWHFDTKRMKQLFDSFNTIKSVKIYNGVLKGNKMSEDSVVELKNLGYEVIAKPVKLINISIDATSIPDNSPALLQQFIKKPLLELLDIGTITLLNQKLADLNKRGSLFIEEKKCNFDVEMGRDMLRDFDLDHIENYILWSVDSDFADPVNQISDDGKKAIIFATSGKVSHELDATGVQIFDVKKVKEFICWPREIPENIKKSMSDI